MSTAKFFCFWMIFSFVSMTAFNAHAAVVNYTLADVTLDDNTQITGTFSWTFDIGDFENGVGLFSSLFLPYGPSMGNPPVPPLEQMGLVITIETGSIEISLDGNFHDYGLDITLKFLQALSPTQPSFIDTSFIEGDPAKGPSKYDCCGNGFEKHDFISGSISPTSPVPIPAALPLFLTALAGLGFIARRRKQTV